MKRPKTLKIGPHKVQVISIPKGKLLDENGNQLFGVYLGDELTIKLERGLRTSKAQEILLHEAQHGLCDDLPTDATFTEEQWIAYMSPKLLQLLQDNPKFVEFLTHDKENKQRLPGEVRGRKESEQAKPDQSGS